MKRLTHHFKELARIDMPKIRFGLQPFPFHDQQNKQFIGLGDPLELSDVTVLIPHDLYYLLQFFDGTHSIEDLTSAYMRRFNSFLQTERLQKLIKKMDDALLLENERSQKRLQQIETNYRKQKIRPPACMGQSYSEDPHEIKKQIERYCKQIVNGTSNSRFKDKQLKGMVVPHIDPRLGGATYASAYKVLEGAQPVDLFVILGISHQYTGHPFVLTTKDFQTPLGTVHTDTTLLSDLQSRCSTNFLRDEIVHRDEHSIEFQTLFLKYFHARKFKILPVLCSFSHDMSPDQRSKFNEFTTAMRDVLETFPGSICFIASVDFSHIGPHYGDDFIPDSFKLAKVEQLDRAVLESLAAQQKKEFDQHFYRSNNKFHICGYAAMRTLLEFLPPSHATQLAYDNAIMDDQRSTVTFASMIFS